MLRGFRGVWALMCALCLCVPCGCVSRGAVLDGDGQTAAEVERSYGQTLAPLSTPTPESTPELTHTPAPDATPDPTPEPTPPPTPAPTPEPTPLPIIEKWGMVDVRAYIPGIVVDMRYATDSNFMQQAVYTSDTCLLVRGAADKLKAAQDIFMQDGYSIKVYDAYRPRSAQQMLWDIAPDKSFVANPKNGSRHNRGAAVDITLVDAATGEELLMPSGYDDFTSHARRDYPGIDPAAKENAAYLTGVMVKCGFTTISNEWWHYDDKDYKKYPLSDHDTAAFYDDSGL